MLFATTTYFLERMGLKSLQDLPPLARSCPRWRNWRPSWGSSGYAGSAQPRFGPEPPQ